MAELTPEAIESTIKQILVTDAFLEMDQESIGVAQELAADLGVDSLGFTQLRIHCERRFGVKIGEDDFNSRRFRSVATVRDLILELTA